MKANIEISTPIIERINIFKRKSESVPKIGLPRVFVETASSRMHSLSRTRLTELKATRSAKFEKFRKSLSGSPKNLLSTQIDITPPKLEMSILVVK